MFCTMFIFSKLDYFMFFSRPGLKSFQKYVLKVLQEVLEAFSRFLGLDPFQKSKFNTKLKFMGTN